MSEGKKRCMICGKMLAGLRGGICEPCQDRIRRDAIGEQAGISDQADRELTRYGGHASQKIASPRDFDRSSV